MVGNVTVYILLRLELILYLPRKYVLKRNLELAFPEMSKSDKDKLSKEVMENSGRALFETGMAWFWPDWRLKRHIAIDKEQLSKRI